LEKGETVHTHTEPPAPLNPFLLAVILAILTIIPCLLLPQHLTMTLLSLLLFGIAAVYFGFAVADGRRNALLIESVVVLIYLGVAVSGLLVSAWWLVAGYVLHGIWDLLHHNRAFGARVVRWYIPFCVLYDWLIALFLLVLIVVQRSASGF
jgi:hypothetical protein